MRERYGKRCIAEFSKGTSGVRLNPKSIFMTLTNWITTLIASEFNARWLGLSTMNSVLKFLRRFSYPGVGIGVALGCVCTKAEVAIRTNSSGSIPT